MKKKFDDNGFEDKEIDNNLKVDDLYEDNINYRRNYDEYYKKVVEDVLGDLNKKNKKKNKIMLTAFACASLFAFSGGFIANNYLNNRVLASTQDMKYELSNNDNRKDKDKTLIEEEVNSKEDKVENKENLSSEEVVKLVSPSVVTITVTSQGNMFTQPKSGVGTGFIVDENGTVVTNYHVIEGATSILITLNEGTEVTAKVVSTSKKDDLAILDIIDDVKMPGIAKLAQGDDINAGQEVIAIGNPLGKEFSGSITKGIISAPKRIVSMDGFDRDFIQIDAAINPGNSGGPLINLKGEIIGVNSAKKGGDNVEGMGFAVTIKYVREMVENPENYVNEDTNNPGNPYDWQQGGGYPGEDYQWVYPYGENSEQYPYGNYSNGDQYGVEQNTNGVKLGAQMV